MSEQDGSDSNQVDPVSTPLTSRQDSVMNPSPLSDRGTAQVKIDDDVGQNKLPSQKSTGRNAQGERPKREQRSHGRDGGNDPKANGQSSTKKNGQGRGRRKRRKPQYFGAIDLGTNNCRLLIARSTADGFKVVDSYSKVVRLGGGLASTGRLADENMDLAVNAIKVCADKLKAKNVKRWRCIATQACRAAENGEAFLARVKSETGLAFETISPKVEARLAVMGVLNIIDPTKDVALVIDIGGGSTELSWVDVRKLARDVEAGKTQRLHRPPIAAWVSLPVGVVNLSEMYPENHDDRTSWYLKMKAHVLEEIRKQDRDKQFTNMFQDGKGHIIGTSGTITSLAGVLMGLPYYQRDKIDGIWVDGPAIIATGRDLIDMPYTQRQAVPCVGEDRATMISAGCAILDVIYELWPSAKIRVADRGLREGMLMGLMNKTQIIPTRKSSQNGK